MMVSDVVFSWCGRLDDKKLLFAIYLYYGTKIGAKHGSIKFCLSHDHVIIEVYTQNSTQVYLFGKILLNSVLFFAKEGMMFKFGCFYIKK